jgi:hypothetical protein
MIEAIAIAVSVGFTMFGLVGLVAFCRTCRSKPVMKASRSDNDLTQLNPVQV